MEDMQGNGGLGLVFDVSSDARFHSFFPVRMVLLTFVFTKYTKSV